MNRIKLGRRALLGVLGLIVSASVAWADQLSDHYKIAEKLGNGAFKDVYAVEGRPDLAIGIFERNQNGGWGNKTNLLEEEKAMLDRIAAVGVPTAIVLEISTYDGKKAYLQKRFATANRAPDWGTKRWEVLNETSIEDCHKIEAALVAAHMNVSDAQFLVGSDGHVVLNDPLSISVSNTPTSSARYVLDQIEREAKEAIEARALAKALQGLPGADDPELADFFKHAQVTFPWNDAAKAAETQEALLHYLETGPTTPEALSVAKAVRDGTVKIDFVNRGQADTVVLTLDRPFPSMAAELLGNVWKKLDTAVVDLEAEVISVAHVLDFLGKKEAPDAVFSQDPLLRRGAELRADPSALARAIADGRGLAQDDVARATLAARANAILGPRLDVTATSHGLTGALGGTIDDLAKPAVDPAGR